MAKTDKTLQVQGVEISITTKEDQDYLSLTDMVAHLEDGTMLIDSWLRSKNTLEFLGVWERMYNPGFNSVEFDRIRLEAGTNRFRMSVKRWVQSVGAVGLLAKAGRYGGTFGHKDIAFEFAAWISPEFKLYLIKEFQRLKDAEIQSGQLEWNIRRTLAKAQYRVHTDAIRDHLIPAQVSKKQQGYVYASEADLLNQALFGMTAKEWATDNPDLVGNVRDHATVEQLVVLSSLESQNALLIQQGMPQGQRLVLLNQLARQQLQSLIDSASVRRLGGAPDLLN